ncbi:hypothetical protein [Streptomyces luteireticuli]|uniref:hypothetical protein n=1 Tax=Streptomyces luteireticuli TaxID=173858 RepID=UPI0035568125
MRNAEDPVPDVADAEILAHRKIHAIAILRDHLGCSLHEAVDAFSARYEELHRKHPADFAAHPEDIRT